MKIISTFITVSCLLSITVLIGCAPTNPNSNAWDYNEYIKSDYQNTPDWREAEAILSELDTPEKVAVYLSNNFNFYDIEFRRRNYSRLDDMRFLKEAVPPPSRLIKTGGATCITAANFARIALEKAGYDVILLRLHNGNIKAAYQSIGTGDAQLHIVCLVQYKNAFYSVGDTWGHMPDRLIWTGEIQGPYESIDDFVNNYIGKFQHSRWKIITAQISTFGHVPEKGNCRGVSCE